MDFQNFTWAINLSWGHMSLSQQMLAYVYWKQTDKQIHRQAKYRDR